MSIKHNNPTRQPAQIHTCEKSAPRRATREMLHEMAYVLHITRSIKKAILDEAACAATAVN